MKPHLQVRDLAKSFRISRGLARSRTLVAVDGVDLELGTGECLAVVGESGSGKSTLARMIVRLLDPDRGQILLQGEDLLALRGAALRRARRTFQIVFQDTSATFSPRQKVRTIVEEPLVAQGFSSADRDQRTERWMSEVGLDQELFTRFPHQLSGGEGQRVAIARALVLEPSLLVADEPVAALDLPEQIRILDLLARLRCDHGLGLLFISHDLSVVERIADRVAVMQAGRFVEVGTVAEVLGRPTHPYTRTLLASVPRFDTRSLEPAAGL